MRYKRQQWQQGLIITMVLQGPAFLWQQDVYLSSKDATKMLVSRRLKFRHKFFLTMNGTKRTTHQTLLQKEVQYQIQ
jgi:hypothetical protein